MQRRVGWCAVIVTVGAGLACQRGEEVPPAREASSRDRTRIERFEPPADGRLSESQVRMYAAVQQRLSGPAAEPQVGSEGGDVLGDLSRPAEAEVAAVEALGYDGEEYRWVKARVMEAQLPEMDGVRELAATMERASLEMLRSRREQARDPQEQARLDEQIAQLEARLEEAARPRDRDADDGALEHNRSLLERYLDAPRRAAPGP